MPKAYLVAHIRVKDDEEFERFKALTQHAINVHDCRLLASNSTPEVHEGNLDGMTVLVEFKSIGAARDFCESEAYLAAKAVREVSAEADLMLVEGL